jgi:tRNA threonylcarbamoyladenosine biosynthesis protein TsaE
MLTLNNITLHDLDKAAKDIIAAAKQHKIWTFYGEMGAGKTTLIKAICKQLGVTEDISSPTFSLVNEYHTQQNEIIYHFDFYRIKNIEEVYDIGYEDYFFSNSICLIEWPEKIEEFLLEEDVLRITIEKQDEEARTILIASST